MIPWVISVAAAGDIGGERGEAILGEGGHIGEGSVGLKRTQFIEETEKNVFFFK